MSHINEALKKAQKERDARHLKYTGILSARGKDRRVFGGRALWLTSLLIIVILLAFASYSWLHSRDQRTPASTERKSPAKPLKTESAVNAKTFYERARRFHKTDRLQDAKRFYQEALRLDPGYVDALNNLGVIYIQDKDYLAAQRSFEKAIRLKPGHVDPHYNLACLHAIKGEVKQSLAHLKKAVSLDHSARDWARRDTDLTNLRGVSEFEEIIGTKGKMEK